MKSVKLAAVAILVTVSMIWGSLSAFAADQPLGLSSELPSSLPSGLAVDQLVQTIDEYYEEHKDTIAAVSVSVFARDEVLMEKYYGYAKIAENIPNDADKVYEWGSVTKLITWVCVMQLVEQGRLDLNADIRTYLPEGFLTKLKYNDKITMYNLMNHNAGWEETDGGFVPDGTVDLRLAENLKKYEPKQVFRPGAVVAYSNWGTALAGYVIELITGKPYYEHAGEKVLSPLGIDKTSLKPDWTDNVWVNEQRHQLNGYDPELNDLGIIDENDALYPAGVALGTIGDLRKFGQALLPDESGASPLFESADIMARLYEPTLYFPDGKTAENSHGFWTYTDLHDVIGHGGNATRCAAGLIFDPVSGIGLATLTNVVNTDAHVYDLSRMLFAEKYGIDDGRPFGEEDYEMIKGRYTLSRSADNGVLKIDSFLYAIRLPDEELQFRELEPGVYNVVFPDETHGLFFAQYGENGEIQKLSVSTMEFLRTNGLYYAFQAALLALLVAAIFYSLAMLIILMIIAILKRRGAASSLNKAPLAGMQIALYGAVILAGLTAAQWYLSDVSTSTDYYVRGILFFLAALVPIVYAAILALKWKRLEKTKVQGTLLLVSGILGLFVTANMFFWEVGLFWTF